MKEPPSTAQIRELAGELHVLMAEILRDYRQVLESGYVQSKTGAGGGGGRPAGDADPTGALAANLFDENSRANSWRRRQALNAMLNAESKLQDARSSLKAAKRALYRPFAPQTRDPMTDQTHYPQTVTKDELKASKVASRARLARGEE